MPVEQSDGYKLIRQVGTGLAGSVWMADGPAGRVAMRRFVSPAPQNGEEWLADRAHFLQAGRQCLAFRHPKVVPVLDVVDDSDDAWIASEFVEDETLESILKHERLSSAQTRPILRSIALVLDQAHRSGIVHGDLKPSNIYMGGKKSVRLADFAISPRARRSPRAELNASWIHPYLTPEHLNAPGTIGPRSDVYALAAIAYYMFTGRPPFSSGGDVRAAILRGQVDSPTAIQSLPGGLEAPLLRAMSRDPGQRFADCSEFVGAVEAGMAGVAGGEKGNSARLIYAGIGSLAIAMIVAAALLLHGPRKTEIANVARLAASGASTLAVPSPAPTGDLNAAKKPRASGGPAAKPAGPAPAIAANEKKPAPFGPAAAPERTPSYPTPNPPVRNPVSQPVSQPMTVARGPEPLARSSAPQETFIPPPDAPKGYSLAVYSRRPDDPKHLIGRGISFPYLDKDLGEMGLGDLKARVILNGPPPGKVHRLAIVWKVDGQIMDGHTVSPNTVTEFGSEPIRGTYQVILILDNNPVADYTFRISP